MTSQTLSANAAAAPPPGTPGRPPPTVAYVLGKFPSLSETFILREVLALRAGGLNPVLCALAHPGAGKVHAAAAALLPEVLWSPGRAAWPRLAGALAGWFLRRPRTLCRAWLAEGRATGAWLRALYHVAEAAGFADAARRRGVRHVHAHFAFVPAEVARTLAALIGCRFSVSVHARDLYTQDGARLRHRLAGAAFVTACTRHGFDLVRRLLPDLAPERLFLLHHGLPPAVLASGGTAGTAILAVGRLEEKKGFGCLIAALGRLAAAGNEAPPCVIAGDGPLCAALVRQAADAGLGARVRFVGAVTQEELAGLLRAAALFVLPSVVAADGDHDGLPNALLEAMAVGLPVVSTTASAAVEVIADGENGLLVPPADPAALADAIARLLRSPQLCARLGAAGQARVRQEFDLARNTAPLVARFRALLAQG
jgi:glycosyltransferase involved in cell wall biosynthesis